MILLNIPQAQTVRFKVHVSGRSPSCLTFKDCKTSWQTDTGSLSGSGTSPETTGAGVQAPEGGVTIGEVGGWGEEGHHCCRRCLAYNAHFIPIVGVGKRGEY